MNIPQLSQTDLDLLRKYDSPTICNVIELFQIRPQTEGYMDDRIRACYPTLPPMVGYGSTATLRTSAKPGKEDVYSSLDAQVAGFAGLPQPVVVVFQDLDDPSTAATFGEVMGSMYKGFGAAGLVTSGAARDLEQVRALDLPCFSDGAICSHGYPRIVDLNVAVRVGGLMVHPGDLLHGDANGVTNIPHEIASEVAHACEEFVAAEQVTIDYVNAGKVTPEGFAQSRAECVRLIRELGERVRAKR